MAENPCSAMADYFQQISIILQTEKDASCVFPNPSDMGQSRENALKEFLKAHLPSRCNVISGGYIFDLNRSSKQLDLIITNDLTMQFKQFGNSGKSFASIEGCYGAISVKSTLDKKSIVECLEEFRSIPDMPRPKINPLMQGRDHLIEKIPFKVIFAFSGLHHDTIIHHMNDFFQKYNVPHNQKPQMIIVNNSYLIEKTGSNGGVLGTGEKVSPHTYFPMSSKRIGGLGLFRIVSSLQDISNIGSQMLLNFNKYDDRIIENLQ